MCSRKIDAEHAWDSRESSYLRAPFEVSCHNDFVLSFPAKRKGAKLRKSPSLRACVMTYLEKHFAGCSRARGRRSRLDPPGNLSKRPSYRGRFLLTPKLGEQSVENERDAACHRLRRSSAHATKCKASGKFWFRSCKADRKLRACFSFQHMKMVVPRLQMLGF